MQVGMNVSHSHVRTKKRSLANLHRFKIKKNGGSIRAYFCTKCLRTVRTEQGKLLSKPFGKGDKTANAKSLKAIREIQEKTEESRVEVKKIVGSTLSEAIERAVEKK